MEGDPAIKGAEAHEKRLRKLDLFSLRSDLTATFNYLMERKKKKTQTKTAEPDSSQICTGQETRQAEAGKNPITY